MAETPYQFSPIELWIQSVLRVPPHPQPPEGSPESTQVFHAGRNYYKLCLLIWLLSHLLCLNSSCSPYPSSSPKRFPLCRSGGRFPTRVIESLGFLGLHRLRLLHVLLPASELRTSLVYGHRSKPEDPLGSVQYAGTHHDVFKHPGNSRNRRTSPKALEARGCRSAVRRRRIQER